MASRLVIPFFCISIANFIITFYCKRLSHAANDVPFRPPNWIFAVVWPLLYVTMGIGWYKSRYDFLYWLCIIGCCTWLYIYSCVENKALSCMILIASAITAWLIFSRGSIWDLPLALWLSFATYLNLYEAFLSRHRCS